MMTTTTMMKVAKGFLVLISCTICSIDNFDLSVDAFHVPTKQHTVVRTSAYHSRPRLPAATATRTTSTALPAYWGLGKTIVVGGLGGAAVCVRKSVHIIQQGDVSIVERVGKFHKRLEPGFHVLIPFVDQIRATVTEREQVLDLSPQKCITSDNAPLVADAVVYWKIVDAKKSIYAVVDLELAIKNLVLTQLRAEIGKLTLDRTFLAREQINQTLLDDLDVATAPWGVKITRVEVRDIVPNTEIVRAMELQMVATRYPKYFNLIWGRILFPSQKDTNLSQKTGSQI